MTESERNKGFVIYGDYQEGPPLRELEAAAYKLDSDRQSLEKWSRQESDLSDQKIYVSSDDDEFQEVTLVRVTSQCVFVRSPCGNTHCLPASLSGTGGEYRRRCGAAVHVFWTGWRLRKHLLAQMETTRKRYARVKSHVVPEIVRSARDAGIAIPHELVERLRPHYGRSA